MTTIFYDDFYLYETQPGFRGPERAAFLKSPVGFLDIKNNGPVIPAF
jgi:hypothetical protein